VNPINLNRKLNATSQFVGLIICASTTVLSAQTTIIGGKGSANISTNKGTVVVQNFNMTPETKKQLEALSRQFSGSSNGWQGVLFPGYKPTDYGSCASLKDHLQDITPLKIDFKKVYVIHLGGSTSICQSLPCNVLAINRKPVVTLIQNKGSIGIQAAFAGEGGKTIASIDGNVVHVNQHIAWYFKRDDAHTIRVVDQENREVLWVSLENKNYVRLRATIVDSSGNIIVTIDDSKVEARNGLLRGSTHGNCTLNPSPPAGDLRTVMLNIDINPDGTIQMDQGIRF
jgi:hypothetical protein